LLIQMALHCGTESSRATLRQIRPPGVSHTPRKI